MLSTCTDITLAIEQDEICLCDVCGGTGINPNDNTCRCSKCDGLKTINRFSVYFRCDVPYLDNSKHIEDTLIIECGIRDIYKSLGLIIDDESRFLYRV